MAAQRAAVVYLIANPNLRTSPAWPRIRADLETRVKGAAVAGFSDLFTDSEDYRARWQDVVRDLAGAVAVATTRGPYLLAGRVALREAADISGAGRPVLLYTPRGLVPWADVRVREFGGSKWLGAELVVAGSRAAR
jgi:hypothetical protein